MASVKCISLNGDSLPSGRRLRPGQTADDVDITNPGVMRRIASGRLVVIDAFDVTTAKIDDILNWVGNDPQRAAAALATETGRPERDQRSTLIDALEELVTTDDDSPEED